MRILAQNVASRIIAHVPVDSEGHPLVRGNCVIPGVPGTGAPIDLEFLDPCGALGADPIGSGRSLLPTGQVRDMVHLADGTQLPVSLVDVGNQVVFVRADSYQSSHQGDREGRWLKRPPAELDGDAKLMSWLEEVRSAASRQAGWSISSGQPKVCAVGPALDYVTSSRTEVRPHEVDLVARVVSAGNIHRTYPASTLIATAAAGQVEGTLVQEVISNSHQPESIATRRGGGASPVAVCSGPAGDGWGGAVRVGHPAGVVSASACMEQLSSRGWLVRSVTLRRTARRIMEGRVMVPHEVLEG